MVQPAEVRELMKAHADYQTSLLARLDQLLMAVREADETQEWLTQTYGDETDD